MVHFFLVTAAAPALTTAPTTLTAEGAPPPIAALWTAAKRLPEATFPIAACQPAARLPSSNAGRTRHKKSFVLKLTCDRAGGPKTYGFEGCWCDNGEKYGPSYDRNRNAGNGRKWIYRCERPMWCQPGTGLETDQLTLLPVA
jgi:hypothetical protein